MARWQILSASAGAGHNRAAEALHECARVSCPGVETEWIDSLKFTNRAFAKLYERSYFWLASSAPDVWGFLYRHGGKDLHKRRLRKVIEFYDRTAYRKLMARVEDFNPDAVLCTHFLPANVITARTRGRLPVYVVVTDFDFHPLWYNRRVEAYFVACEEVKVLLARCGYPADRIHVTGIPIHPVFAQEPLRTPSNRPSVLFMSGGFGMGHMEKALERLLDIDLPFRLTVVAGKNERMRRKLVSLAAGRAEIHGFVNTIHDLMAASDLIITKAGGLTVSECLARRLPMVLFAPIPGQEEANADYLIECGAALKARSLDVLDFKVRELLANPARLDMMRRAASAAARPAAGREILRFLLDENPSG